MPGTPVALSVLASLMEMTTVQIREPQYQLKINLDRALEMGQLDHKQIGRSWKQENAKGQSSTKPLYINSFGECGKG